MLAAFCDMETILSTELTQNYIRFFTLFATNPRGTFLKTLALLLLEENIIGDTIWNFDCSETIGHSDVLVIYTSYNRECIKN